MDGDCKQSAISEWTMAAKAQVRPEYEWLERLSAGYDVSNSNTSTEPNLSQHRGVARFKVKGDWATKQSHTEKALG